MTESKFQIESSNHLCLDCEEDIPWGDDYYSAVIFREEQSEFGRSNFCRSCWSHETRSSGPQKAGLQDAGPRDAGPQDDGEENPEETSKPRTFFAYWKTQRPELQEGPRQKMRFDPLVVLDFFRRLSEDLENASETEAVAETETEAETEAEAEAVAETETETETEAETNTEKDESSGPGLVGTHQKRDLRFVLSLLLLRKKVLVFKGSAVDEVGEWLWLSEKAESEHEYWVENPELSDDELERVRDDIGELLQLNI